MKVWDCSVQCYDQRLISEGRRAVEDQYVWLSFLPFEDAGSNETLDAFLKYNKKPDGFGAQAWVAGELFARAVERHRRGRRPERHHPRRDRSRAIDEHPRLRRRRLHPADRHRRQERQRRASSGCRCRTASSCASTRPSQGKFDCAGEIGDDHPRPGEGVQGLSHSAAEEHHLRSVRRTARVGGTILFVVATRCAWAGTRSPPTSLVNMLLFALPLAGIYAMSATGLVVVYTTTGIFNFAQGAHRHVPRRTCTGS